MGKGPATGGAAVSAKLLSPRLHIGHAVVYEPYTATTRHLSVDAAANDNDDVTCCCDDTTV
jgi:hypothetical protein